MGAGDWAGDAPVCVVGIVCEFGVGLFGGCHLLHLGDSHAPRIRGAKRPSGWGLLFGRHGLSGGLVSVAQGKPGEGSLVPASKTKGGREVWC